MLYIYNNQAQSYPYHGVSLSPPFSTGAPPPPMMHQPGPHGGPHPGGPPYHPGTPHPGQGDRVPLTGTVPAGYGSVTYVTTHTVPAHEVIIVGGCPACRVSVTGDSWSLGLWNPGVGQI